MADPDDVDGENFVHDLVDDAVVADANSIGPVGAGEFGLGIEDTMVIYWSGPGERPGGPAVSSRGAEAPG